MKLLTPEQLDYLNDTSTGGELFHNEDIKALRHAIMQNVGLAKSYQPQFNAVVDAIDDYRNEQFKRAGRVCNGY